MKQAPLIDTSYSPTHPTFLIRIPSLRSGSRYHFFNDQGLRYQVVFGRKKSCYLDIVINFEVVSDDYEDEYAETRKGEVYKVIATIIEIVRIFHENHPLSQSYEFSGEFRENETETGASIRTRLFLRSLKKAVDFRFWKVELLNNKVVLHRKNDA